MISEMPKAGTLVRRKKDDRLYTVGKITTYVRGDYVTLHPVWEGRTHEKTVTHFLNQYKISGS